MKDNDQAHVALLIDFENLVYGLQDLHGEEFAQHLDPDLLVRLAEESGQVVLANAYGDWRTRDLNQFQSELYRLGIDLIHVLGRRQQNRMKNAVDVKMAVDAIEAIWTLPHVKTFVIVSGDRDFIHVLKTLRRHGRTVIGVSPDQSVSEDFAALCDRFVRYGALSGSLEPEIGTTASEAAGRIPLQAVRDALRELMIELPGGLKGAQIKPLLRRRLSATFDESEYGFTRLTDLLLSMADVVRVVGNTGGSDITIVAAGPEEPESMQASGVNANPAQISLPSENLIKQAKLGQFAFDRNPASRRGILHRLFNAMKPYEPFTLDEAFERAVQEGDSAPVTVSRLAKYQYVLWQSRSFVIDLNQKDKPLRERLMRMDSDITTADDLVFRYEASIVLKLLSAAKSGGGEVVTAEAVRLVLGLDLTEESDRYCGRLLARWSSPAPAAAETA